MMAANAVRTPQNQGIQPDRTAAHCRNREDSPTTHPPQNPSYPSATFSRFVCFGLTLFRARPPRSADGKLRMPLSFRIFLSAKSCVEMRSARKRESSDAKTHICESCRTALAIDEDQRRTCNDLARILRRDVRHERRRVRSQEDRDRAVDLLRDDAFVGGQDNGGVRGAGEHLTGERGGDGADRGARLKVKLRSRLEERRLRRKPSARLRKDEVQSDAPLTWRRECSAADSP